MSPVKNFFGLLLLSLLNIHIPLIWASIPLHNSFPYKSPSLLPYPDASSQNMSIISLTTPSEMKTAYQVSNFSQPVDHSFPTKFPLWSQKVLTVNNSWLGREKSGPILFLTGCEVGIVDIFNGNGFFNDVVIPQVGAFAIYAEHRYFGDSLPFGNQSFEKKNLFYLSADQALEDFAEVIKYYKTQVLNCSECPVITYGGSYCGELASWMRMRHPSLVDGAVASSAPIRYYESVVDPEAFYAKSTQIFNESSTPGSGDLIKDGFARLKRDSSSPQAFQEINKYLNLCSPMKSSADVVTLYNWFSMAYQMGSMQNAPQISGIDAGKKLIDIATKYFEGLNSRSSNQQLYLAMRSAAMVSMRQDPKKCLNIFSYGQVEFSAWGILTCSDIVVTMGPDGKRDMYPAYPWNAVAKTVECMQDYTLRPKFKWVFDNFGGRILSDYTRYSNIFFSNGKSDPWIVGGVTQNITESVVAFLIEDGCHVQDMYYPSQYDSSSLKFVREKIIEYIKKWITGKREGTAKAQSGFKRVTS